MTDNQELVIVTVGMTDPSETEYFSEIRKSMQRTADAKAMLETYDKQVDFVDFNALEKIV